MFTQDPTRGSSSGSRASVDRRSDDDVRLARVAVKRNLEDGEENHVKGRPLGTSHLTKAFDDFLGTEKGIMPPR